MATTSSPRKKSVEGHGFEVKLAKVKVTKNYVRYEAPEDGQPIPNVYIDKLIAEAAGLGDEIVVTVE
jgi:hypothetical protein